MPLGAYESLWEWVLYIVWIINRVYKSPLRMAYRELDSLFLNTFNSSISFKDNENSK